MKKRVKILLWMLWIVVVLLWVSCYLWYKSYDSNDEEPSYKHCRTKEGWECPQWFIEENGLNNSFFNMVMELPEWWEEAGCKLVERLICANDLN